MSGVITTNKWKDGEVLWFDVLVLTTTTQNVSVVTQVDKTTIPISEIDGIVQIATQTV